MVFLLFGIFVLYLMVGYNNIAVPIYSNDPAISTASTLGENWTLAEVVSDESSSNIYYMDVATDSQGNIHVIYSVSYHLYYKVWNNTIKRWIQKPSFVDTPGYDIYDPRIDVDPSDDSIHVVWWNPGYDCFYINISLGGSSWSPKVQFNDDLDTYDDWFPNLAADSNGIVHILWEEIVSISPPRRQMLYRSLNTSSGNWTDEVVIYSGIDRAVSSIDCEIDSNDDLFVVFEDRWYQNEYNINYMIRNGTTGVWDRNATNSNRGYVIETGGSQDWAPQIAFDSQDNLHIVWDDGYDIGYKCYNASTGTLMPLEMLTDDFEMNIQAPYIVVDKDGDDKIHVVYKTPVNKQGAGTDYDVFYTCKNDTDWSEAELVSHESTSNSLYTKGIVIKSSISAPLVFWLDNTNYNLSGTDWDIFCKIRVSNMNIGTPALDVIIPSNSSTGFIELNWSAATNATKYHVIRSLSPIENISNGFLPLNTTNLTSYNETISNSGTYYYVIVASNKTYVSPVSNCESVIVDFLPVANFTVNTTSIAEWGWVNFTYNGDEGDPSATYSWDFGDGHTSNEQNPIHQYTQNGTFTIILNVTDADGDKDILERSDYIIVSNNPPIATFIANITSIHIGEWVEFNHTGVIGDGNLTYEWDFGDGFNSTEASPTHQYLLVGNYTVTLKVIDADNDTDIYTRPNYIGVYNNIPIANFTANITSIHIGGWIEFTYTGTHGDGNHIYMWIFGDGSNSTDANPTHQYHIGGTYTVSLMIMDADGDNDTVIRVNYIAVHSETQNIPSFPVVLIFLGILVSYGLIYLVKLKKKLQ